MPKVIAKSPIEHDGERYAAGDSFTCTDDEAAALASAKAIEASAEATDDGASEPAPKPSKRRKAA